MKKLCSVLLFLALIGVITGCAGKNIKSYEGTEPRFEPEKFFDGHVKAWGFSETRFGSINQWFHADFYGTSTGDTLIMHEDLFYSDGRKIERNWTIVRESKHRYSVNATDMVGTGTGLAYGNAVQWNYYMNVSVGSGKWTMWFDDWMYLKDEKTMVDKAIISKYGLTVGRAYIFFRKVDNSIPAKVSVPFLKK